MGRSVAIATGASRSIGRATAIRLAWDFSTVVIVARSAEMLRDTASKLQAGGAESLVLDLDLRESASVEAVVRQIRPMSYADGMKHLSSLKIRVYQLHDWGGRA
jgi:NADP-dependent 3-hydroxy acid dehydrogenase YdfG